MASMHRSVKPSLTIVTCLDMNNIAASSFLNLTPTPISASFFDSFIDSAYSSPVAPSSSSSSNSSTTSPTSAQVDVSDMSIEDSLDLLEDFACKYEHMHPDGTLCPLAVCSLNRWTDDQQVDQYIPLSVRMFSQWKGWNGEAVRVHDEVLIDPYMTAEECHENRYHQQLHVKA